MNFLLTLEESCEFVLLKETDLVLISLLLSKLVGSGALILSELVSSLHHKAVDRVEGNLTQWFLSCRNYDYNDSLL